MRIELVADLGKKKDCIKKLSRGSYRIGLYFFSLKACSLFRWLSPALVIVIQTVQTIARGIGFKSYELTAMVIKCLTLLLAFSFGRWLLQFFVNRITGGLSLDNEKEKIAIHDAGVLRYSFTFKHRRKVEMIPLNDVLIKLNEEVGILSFSGKIASYEEKNNGNLIPAKEKQKEILVDYFVPSLVETLKSYERGERK